MKIQLMTYMGEAQYNDYGVTISNLSTPVSPDEFDLCILDLRSEYAWYCISEQLLTISAERDICFISEMIKRSKTCKLLIVLPKDFYVCYAFNVVYNKYTKSVRLREKISFLWQIILSKYFQLSPHCCLSYEPTTTTIEDIEFSADYYFNDNTFIDELKPISYSDKSEKPSTVKKQNMVLTTLDILEDKKHFDTFISYLFPEDELPEWVVEYNFFNDAAARKEIERCQNEIERIIDKEKTFLQCIERNNYYKRALVENDKGLVQIVLDILQRMLNYDLSGFIDEHKEDFLIERDQYAFIGEIKGLTSNVKYQHVSQVDTNKGIYLEKLNSEGKEKVVYSLLIVNPCRKKPLSERNPIAPEQIRLAERNGCLIIETWVLLKLFEAFLNHELTTDDCEAILKENIGLLTTDRIQEKKKNYDQL